MFCEVNIKKISKAKLETLNSEKMNLTQEILLKEGKMLPVMEHFYTLQGEGAHTGKAAYFIRLGGCDVGCHWCDVKKVGIQTSSINEFRRNCRNCSQLL
jgi:hypothetical protein